jgi:hypothetical protein
MSVYAGTQGIMEPIEVKNSETKFWSLKSKEKVKWVDSGAPIIPHDDAHFTRLRQTMRPFE